MTQDKHTPGYEVTPDGRVFSVSHNWRGYGRRELAQQLNSHGYPSVRLSVAGHRKRIAVHRLVAAEYLAPRPSIEHEIRHLNGDRTDNRASNLAWGTRRENAADREAHGRTYHMTTEEARRKAQLSVVVRRRQKETVHV